MYNDGKELQVIVLAKRLAKHSINLSDNPKTFPKRLRFSLTNPIQSEVREIVGLLVSANNLFSTDDTQYQQRIISQCKAISLCDILSCDVERALERGCIDTDQCKYWQRLITEVKMKAVAWKNSDCKRHITN